MSVGTAVRTWADGFGTWHASVPNDLPNPRRTAREAIRRELAARGDLHTGYAVRVELERREPWLGANRSVYREVCDIKTPHYGNHGRTS